MIKEEKGPAAKHIQLLGAAGNQAQQMKALLWPKLGCFMHGMELRKGWGKGFPFLKGWGKGWGKGKV